MDVTQVIDVLRDGVFVAIKIAAPMLLLSMLVGVLISIFQAVTQIHEQTIGFALKLVVIIIICLVYGNKMLEMMVEYARSLYTLMLS